MPRARSPDSIKAERMYHDGMKLIDIAEELGVPAGTVRRWKSTQKWDEVTSDRPEESKKSEKPPKPERSQKKKPVKKTTKKPAKKNAKKKTSVRKKKLGGQPGNKNAVGNKASLPGNQKAVKHGAYRSIFFRFLSNEDKELLESMQDIDTEDRLLLEIQVLTIRERRVMEAIEKQGAVDQYVSAVVYEEDDRRFMDSRESDLYKEVKGRLVASGQALPGEPAKRITRTEATINLIARLDQELSTIQKQIANDLKLLEELRQSRKDEFHRNRKKALEIELMDARIEQVDAQTNKLLGTNLELEDTSEIDDLIYGEAEKADEVIVDGIADTEEGKDHEDDAQSPEMPDTGTEGSKEAEDD